MYTFRFIVGKIIPKSAKSIHSATKVKSCKAPGSNLRGKSSGFRVSRGPGKDVALVRGSAGFRV